jgi:hypothetical protein
MIFLLSETRQTVADEITFRVPSGVNFNNHLKAPKPWNVLLNVKSIFYLINDPAFWH